MLLALCGFADLVRRHGGDVGSAELIDAAQALTLVDLADRRCVHRALRLSMAWSSVRPDVFDNLFAQWFSGDDVQLPTPVDDELSAGDSAVTLDADAIEALDVHHHDAISVEVRDDQADRNDDIAARGDADPSPTRATATPAIDDGARTNATGGIAPRPPGDDDDAEAQRGLAVVELPNDPVAAELELARRALDEAVQRRRRVVAKAAARRVTTVSDPLTQLERSQLVHAVRRIGQRLDGAPSWQHRRSHAGSIDLRRTMRASVTTAGIPIELRHTNRRASAARLVVLADLSLSVRGTARVVMNLLHRMRSMSGDVRAFGFVDVCVALDRALRVADPARAIAQVFGSVDADAASDPGAAFRQWWSRWNLLVTPQTHVMVLSDGRCNGRDPALDIIDRIARRSASTSWISPEPQGAWSLGRGEMALYAERVDRAVTVRSFDDLDQLVADGGAATRRRPA
ncbi:MAG: VWA domain-containing protein [Ilumatobacteraceae bacterium]|nr:VWA domain-containing protein [Ilumatobacteraceae bacterium]